MADGKINPPKWYNVNEDARIWSGHSASAQKQGWLRAPAAILAIDEYHGSYQFVDYKVGVSDGRDEIVLKEGYPHLFIRVADTSLVPYADPIPDPAGPASEPDDEPAPAVPGPEPVAGDAELGAAFRTIIAYIASYFN